MNFPERFGVITADLARSDLGRVGNQAVQQLEAQGLRVQLGLEQSHISQIQSIAGSHAVREYCPNDIENRFDSISSTKRWLTKGRGFFELRNNEDNEIAGYGWTGPGISDQVPDGDTTFALRISPEYSGRHLGTPFTKAMVAGSLAVFGKRDIWLETWGSNSKAVGCYIHSGAYLVATKDAYRSTLYPADNESDGRRRDVRLFMRFALSDYLIPKDNLCAE